MLIHLAATPDDVEDPVNDLFPPNITGLYHVLEAARAADKVMPTRTRIAALE